MNQQNPDNAHNITTTTGEPVSIVLDNRSRVMWSDNWPALIGDIGKNPALHSAHHGGGLNAATVYYFPTDYRLTREEAAREHLKRAEEFAPLASMRSSAELNITDARDALHRRRFSEVCRLAARSLAYSVGKSSPLYTEALESFARLQEKEQEDIDEILEALSRR